jgi:hypothetical protein
MTEIDVHRWFFAYLLIFVVFPLSALLVAAEI